MHSDSGTRHSAAAALTSIVAAITITITVRQLTNNVDYGILSPPAIKIATTTIVMLAFRLLHPQQAQENISFAGGTNAN